MAEQSTSDERSTEQVSVRDAPDAQRFEIWVGDLLAGFTTYQSREGARAFVHTEIDPSMEGRGLAGKLVQAALDATRSAGLGVLPVCPYVRRYVQRHPEHLDLVPEDARARFGLAASPPDTA